MSQNFNSQKCPASCHAQSASRHHPMWCHVPPSVEHLGSSGVVVQAKPVIHWSSISLESENSSASSLGDGLALTFLPTSGYDGISKQ